MTRRWVRPAAGSYVFDFTTGTLPSGVTLTRASSGTRFDSSGVLVTETTDIARFTYNPASLAIQGLLNEPARTNLVLQSNLAASWTNNGVTVAANFDTSPDGGTTAAKMTEGATTSPHDVYQNITLGSGVAVAFSVYAKAVDRTAAMVPFQGASSNNWFSTIYDLSGVSVSQTGVGATSGTITGSAIETINNGWFRGSTLGSVGTANPYPSLGPAPAASGNTFTVDGEISYLGDITKSIYFYGVQVEAAADVSTLIPTTTATATRAAEVTTITNAVIPDGTYTVDIVRLSGTTHLTGVTVSGGYVVPTDVSPLRSVTFS